MDSSMGMPLVNPTASNPMEDTLYGAVSSRVAGWWDSIADAIETASGYSWDVLTGDEDPVGDAIKNVYTSAKDEVKSAINEVSEGAGSVLDFGVNRIILLAVVAGAVLYFVGRSGVLKQLKS